ncbi:hypothetical protein F610DRAFT_06841 [Streptomyces sp. LaPpAH-199]|nr:hypothetical protein F610DRAFT_06841 [Streptomyces sp. LaPpAH-199]
MSASNSRPLAADDQKKTLSEKVKEVNRRSEKPYPK